MRLDGRFHGLVRLGGRLLAPAGPHDSKMGEVLVQESHTVWVLGDNAFRRPDAAQRLKERHGITVLAPPQRSQARVPWPQPLERLTRRLRRRIESALGVLTIVFPIEAPGSRSLGGLVARVATRILAYAISFLTAAFLQPEKN